MPLFSVIFKIAPTFQLLEEMERKKNIQIYIYGNMFMLSHLHDRRKSKMIISIVMCSRCTYTSFRLFYASYSKQIEHVITHCLNLIV